MRLGAELHLDITSPEQWIGALQERGYRAAIWPFGGSLGDDEADAYAAAARAADITIAEVGAWGNPLSRDEAERKERIARCQVCLATAERIGARCCVNVAGSRGPSWCGPHPDDLSEDTFALIVDTVREIVDAVRPQCTCYTLETMPWMYPDSPDAYLRLLDAVDRPAFAVHLDPVNLINCPQRYFQNGAFLRECFAKLGPRIRSCHAKDVILEDRLTVHLDERPPGEGRLDYRTYLECIAAVDPEMPLLMEHFDEDAFARGAAYIRQVEAERLAAEPG